MSFFLPFIVILGLLTFEALLVLHLCRFQQLQHLYYWHHHHLCHHRYVEATLFRSTEIPVKYRLHGQEKIVQWLNKKLETVKKELQCKISKPPK